MFREKLLTLWSLAKSNRLASLLGFVGILLVSIGLFTTVLAPAKEEEIKIEGGQSKAKIYVDVQGAVVKPGVYGLNENSRLQDGLVAAGGLSGNADREWVGKNLNLAKRLEDGAKIYIPLARESVSRSVGDSESQVIGASVGLININAASSSELDKLPGIGPVTAQKIIDNRPYSEIGELSSKKVIGQKVFDQIKDKVTAY